jgi:alanine dehydrogenase
MIIGVPKEIKTEEGRVAITPAGVTALVAHGHSVLIEKGAGKGSFIPDAEYRAVGAAVVPKAETVWKRAQMVLKVKEPLPSEYRYLRPDLILFTYLHLAADEAQTRALMKSGCTAVAYETIELPDGSLPLLAPMSEVAGKLSIQVGAHCLEANQGGSGLLLSGVSGVAPAKVTVIGAGVSGKSACQVAVGLGAQVTIMDINPTRLRYIHDITQGRVVTLMSNAANLKRELATCDLLIGAVLIPGAKAPKLLKRKHLKMMKPGSALVDIAIDQGGIAETSRPTTHKDPTYLVDRIVHYCVANMPGIVPQTSTYALTNATMTYAIELADKGLARAVAESDALAKGVNVIRGRVTCPGVAAAWRLPAADLSSVL